MGITDVRPVGHMQPATFGKHVRDHLTETYGRGRRCAAGCGAVLSQYNPDDECATCKRREKTGIAALESLARKRKSIELSDARSPDRWAA